MSSQNPIFAILGEPAPQARKNPVFDILSTPSQQEDGPAMKRIMATPLGTPEERAALDNKDDSDPWARYGRPKTERAVPNPLAQNGPVATYISGKLKSGLHSLAATGFQLWWDLVGVDEAEMAELFKNDPKGLAKVKKSAGYLPAKWAHQEERLSEKAIEDLPQDLKDRFEALTYATTDPRKAAWASPTRMFGDAIQSLPTTTALALTAYVTRGTATRTEAAALARGATAQEAKKLAVQAAAKTAAKVAAASEGTIGGVQQQRQSQSHIEDMPQSELEQSPQYQELIKQGWSPEAARMKLAADTGKSAGLDAGVVDATTNLVGGGVLGKIIGEGGPLLGRTAKGALNEGATEAVQSAGEQVGQNAAIQENIDPNQSLSEGVVESGAQGFFVGGGTGGGAAATFGGGRAPRPVTEGVKAKAATEAAIVTPEDEASPLPTDLISKGKAAAAGAVAGSEADAILERHGMPKTGTPVRIDMGQGDTVDGVMSDAFDEGDARGLVITTPDGKSWREHFDDLRDAGVTITPRDEADAIDAQLAAAAQNGAANAAPKEPVGEEEPVGSAPRPVADAKAIVEALHPDAVVTSQARSADNPLSKANPTSWHTKSNAAVDVRPIKDMTFEQFVQGFKDKGYSVIEAIDEVRHPSAHATGPHWHIVLGEQVHEPQVSGSAAAAQESTEAPPVESAAIPDDVRPSLLDETVEANVSGDEAADLEKRGLGPASLLSAVPAKGEPGVTVTHDGEHLAQAVFRDPEGNAMGVVQLPTSEQARAIYGGVSSYVRPEDRRQGIATRLYDALAQSGYRIDRLSGTGDLTPDGAALVSARRNRASVSRPALRIEPTSTGKSIAISGATDEQLAAIQTAVPTARGVRRNDGATVYAAKYEDQVKAALGEQHGQDMAGAKINEDWTGFAEDSGSLNIPRAEMPQVKAEHRGAMVNFLNARDVSHQEEVVESASLKPSQVEFSPAKVQKAKDHDGGDRAILISRDGHIADGHHQWLAARDKGEPVRAIRLDAPIGDLLPLMREFPSSQVSDGASAPVAAQPETKMQALKRRIAEKRAGTSQTATMMPRGEEQASSHTEDKAASDAQIELAKRPDIKSEKESRTGGEASGNAAADAKTTEDDEAHKNRSASEATPVAVLTGKEFGKLPAAGKARMTLLRGRVGEWYERNLLGAKVTSSDGREVTFNPRGMKKTMRGGDRLLRSVPAIPAIIEKGWIEETRPGDGQGTKAMHIYAAPVDLAGERLLLGVMVRETQDGHLQYSLNEIEPDATAEAAGGDERSSIRAELEAGDGPKLNLFFIGAENNGVGDGLSPSALDELRQHLSQAGLTDRVAGSVVETIRNDPNVAGRYLPGLIEIAASVAQDRAFTANHEIIHALRDMGLFLPAEWAALERRARGDAALMESARRRYDRLSEDAQVEEAVADLFASWARTRTERGFVGRAFDRLMSFLSALHSWTQGHGFVSAEGVMRAVERGEIGARPASVPFQSEASAPDQGRNVAPAGRRIDITEPEAASNEGEKLSIVDRVANPFRRDAATPVDEAEAPHVALVDAFRGNVDPLGEKFRETMDDWRIKLQDKLLPVLRMQQRVERDLGRSLDDFENPYLQEELLSGRVGARLERLTDEVIAPMFDAMHEYKISIDELEGYLYARHAPERNARISQINPEFQPGEGSGMTDVQARAILHRIERDGRTADFEDAARYVDRMRDDALQTRIDAGLLSEDEANAWRDTYRNYVPLRGRAEVETGDASANDVIRRQRGVSVKGKESKRAYGRRSEADDLLAYSMLQAQEAIVRAETNMVARAFHDLARANPDPDFWTIDKIERMPRFNSASGMVEHYTDNRIAADDAPFTVSLKIDGVEHRVTMNRDNAQAVKVATAMRNLSGEQFGAVMRGLSALSRAYSAINTRYSPPFIIKNALRDVQTAAVNLQQFSKEMPGLTRAVLRDYRNAMFAQKKGDGEWSKWRNEWELAGGKIYYNQTGDLNLIRKQIDAKVKRLQDPNALREAAGRFFDAVEGANEAVERGVRLATYANARRMGRSPAQAASMARNVTVNFTRRGEWGPVLNAFYPFFNASIQGGAVFAKAMKSPRVRYAVAAFVMAGFLSDMLNSMLSDDDDDGMSLWDKVPSYDKNKNAFLMLPGKQGGAIKLPLPPGLNAFWNLGRNTAAAMRGAVSTKDASFDVVLNLIDAFNPIGSISSDDPLTALAKMAAPTPVGRMTAELMLNSDFAGRKIYNDSPFNPPVADSNLAFPNTSPAAKKMAKALNSATGGDDVLPGLVDMHPETLEYLMAYATGGAGRVANQLVSLGLAPFDPSAEMTVRDVPIARDFYSEKAPYIDRSILYDRLRVIKEADERADEYDKNGDTVGLKRFEEGNAMLLDLAAAAKQTSEFMRSINKDRKANQRKYDGGEIDRSTYLAAKRSLEDEEGIEVTWFNREWNMRLKGETAGDPLADEPEGESSQ